MGVHVVDAYPEKCEVHTYRRSKTVWVATGTFRNEPLSQTGRTEAAALRIWKDIAESRYRSS